MFSFHWDFEKKEFSSKMCFSQTLKLKKYMKLGKPKCYGENAHVLTAENYQVAVKIVLL